MDYNEDHSDTGYNTDHNTDSRHPALIPNRLVEFLVTCREVNPGG